MKAAEQRAKEKEAIASYQREQCVWSHRIISFITFDALYRIKVKDAAKEKERQEAIDNQKQIDGEVAEHYASQKARELDEHAARLEHRRLLDKVLADKKRNEERKKEMDLAEEREIEVFAAAKRVTISKL